jgi:CDP-diacylglycerol--glycerol-3-phosphate 3-phosphatidyltransferase
VKLTANMVTMMRIVLMPAPCLMLLYGDNILQWLAVLAYTLLAMTDFIDGYMARRDGPTKIGGLIDPVADKIFIAALFFPLASMGVAPAWFIMAIFMRELLVTGLRSSAAWRKAAITTSRLAKMKTIIQLGGAVSIFLVLKLPKSYLIYLACCFAGLTFIAWLYMKVSSKHRPFFWMLPTVPCYLLVGFAALFFSKDIVIMIHLVVIAGLTWLSGLDYIVGAAGIFRKSRLARYDFARLIWSFSWPLLALPAVAWWPSTMLPMLLAISCELVLGGVDNVAVAEKAESPDYYNFLITGLSAALFGVGMWFNLWGSEGSIPIWIPTLVLGLISLSVMTVSFKKHANLFAKAI